MGGKNSIKKYIEYIFDDSDKTAEENHRWKSMQSGKKKSRLGDSPVDNYTFLESFAGGMEPEETKLKNETVIIDEVDDVDEAVKERIFQSDAALQSSSSNHHSDFTQSLHLADNEPVSIISDEENDDLSMMSSNDIADAGGSSDDQILEDETNADEMESGVVVRPEYVTYGRKRFSKAQLTFFCSSIKLDVLEDERPMGCLTFEWKIVDLISIESRWVDPFKTACVCLHIKSEHPKRVTRSQKSGILEVKFNVCNPNWNFLQALIKSLNEQYEEKWDVDLDLYDSFEGVTYLEGNCGSISISNRDFQLLEPERFINDTIVDFYIEYLKKKIEPADERFHFFNSFFFKKLADFDKNENHLQDFDATSAFQRVRKWTKKVNVFQKDFIFIPVNFRLHWSLIVICHPGEIVNFKDEEMEISLKVPCILHMDSIIGSHRGLEYCIRRYLWEEWKERNSTTQDVSTQFMNLRFLRLEVPQQQNSYDCALFMLHFIELFVKHAPISFNPLNNFMSKDWFYPTEASLKRNRIKKLICELAKTKPPHFSEENDLNDEESEVQILNEEYDSKETCGASNSETCVNSSRDDTAPIMVKPLKSVPYDVNNDDQMDIGPFNSNEATGVLRSSIHELLKSHCQESPESDDNDDGLSIAENENDYGRLVVYDPSNVVSSPIKESDETEDVLNKQVVITEPPLSLPNSKTKNTDSFLTRIDKSMNLLQLKEKHPAEQHSGILGIPSSLRDDDDDDVCEALVRDDDDDDDVCEALVIEDSEDEQRCSSSSDDVFEAHVVVDSDSDDDDSAQNPRYRGKFAASSSSCIRKDVSGNRLNIQSSKRRPPLLSLSQARKKLRRKNSSDDVHEISFCE